MKSRSCLPSLILIAGLALGTKAFAHEPTKPQATSPDVGPPITQGMPVYVESIAPAAFDAVKVVDAFSAAIKSVKLAEAEKLLDPQVLILESGGSERSRDEYMRAHAIEDAAFMQTAKQELRYRQAQADGNMAWVATESVLEAVENGKHVRLLSTETMLLKKTDAGWKIVHIHWSSRRKK